MKVLDAKIWPPQRPGPYQRACPQCTSVLEIEVEDLKAHRASRTGDSYADSENFTCFYVDCPQCAKHIEVAELGRGHMDPYWEQHVVDRSAVMYRSAAVSRAGRLIVDSPMHGRAGAHER